MHLYQASDIRTRPARLPSLLSRHLLARSLRSRPWRHVPALKTLVRDLHSDSAAQCDSSQDVWEPARRFFERRKAHLEDLSGTGAWHRWSEEIELDMAQDGSDGYEGPPHIQACARSPADTHIYASCPWKRRASSRVFFLFLSWVAADMYFEDQTISMTQGEPNAAPQSKDRPRSDSMNDRRGLPRKAAVLPPNHRLNLLRTHRAPCGRVTGPAASDQGAVCAQADSTVRFTWSDMKLWTELDRILQLDADTNGVARAHRASVPVWAWTDAWGVYEDVCVVRARASGAVAMAMESVDRATDDRGQGPRARRCAHGDDIEGDRSSYRPPARRRRRKVRLQRRIRGRRGAGAQPADAHYARAAADVPCASSSPASPPSSRPHHLLPRMRG
ncbi:hypothetical protein EDB86DRAFT_2230338 [Lactarius hatsudake]|nr:hypothetical protein EDB86DRAFT_2230338 [Lactarius hatsudake]